MDHEALGTYLNDHLAGSTLGADHARQLEERTAGTPFGLTMARIAGEIEEDRDTLVKLMEKLDVSRNPVKAAGAWVAEKAGRVKFSGGTSGDPDIGYLMAVETMSLGVEGKRGLWTALQTIAPAEPALAEFDLPRLIERATSQRAALEDEREATARQVLGGGVKATT